MPLPAHLRRRPKRKLTRVERFARFDEVISYYGLQKPSPDTMSLEPTDKAAALKFWAPLAGALLQEFVLGPPLRTRDSLAYDQARFVECINSLMKRHGRSQTWIFKWLVNERDPVGPRDARKRLHHLPERYRTRMGKGSLKIAFVKIPARIRNAPDSFRELRAMYGLRNLPRSSGVLIPDTSTKKLGKTGVPSLSEKYGGSWSPPR